MEIAILLVLFVANGMFAMSEIALVSSRRVRLERMAEAGSGGARAALALASHPGRFLSTVQVGITLIGIFSGAFGEATLVEDLQPVVAAWPLVGDHAYEVSLGLIVVGITYASLIIGELVPKRLALHAPEAIASRIAGPMQVLSRIMSPFVKLLTLSTEGVLRLFGVREKVEETVTEAEIEGLMRQGAEAGVFETAETQFVSRVLRLDSQRVGAVMTPRVDVAYLDVDAPLDENLGILRREGYTRVPVCRDGFNEVLGILDTQDLLDAALAGRPIDLTASLRPPLYVPDSVDLMRLLERFKQHKAHLALVLDEYGEVQGLVTMTDVLEAIVGDVPDSDDEVEPDVVRRADGSLLVDGGVSLARLGEAVGHDVGPPADERDAYHTLGGLAMTRLGRVPRVGDRFRFAHLVFEVVDMDRHRVDRLLVTPLPEDNPESGAGDDG
jgi:putative hemolysin